MAANRHGAILLARHGEPALSRKVRLTAEQYGTFWEKYEVGGILPGQTPPSRLIAAVSASGILVASSRRRSVESLQLLAPAREFTRHDILIEAPLPPPPWPAWVRFTPSVWGFCARFWWWFFDHHGGQETRAEAERRADAAADMLVGVATDGRDVAVLAHGFFNLMIGRALKRRGWRQTAGEGYKYWSTRRFERT